MDQIDALRQEHGQAARNAIGQLKSELESVEQQVQQASDELHHARQTERHADAAANAISLMIQRNLVASRAIRDSEEAQRIVGGQHKSAQGIQLKIRGLKKRRDDLTSEIATLESFISPDANMIDPDS